MGFDCNVDPVQGFKTQKRPFLTMSVDLGLRGERGADEQISARVTIWYAPSDTRDPLRSPQ